MQLRLVAGPLTMPRRREICAASRRMTVLRDAVFDGQRLAMTAEEPVPPTSLSPQARDIKIFRAPAGLSEARGDGRGAREKARAAAHAVVILQAAELEKHAIPMPWIEISFVLAATSAAASPALSHQAFPIIFAE